jgi:hypothetical protein
MSGKPVPVELRFWKFVDQSSACWIWTGATAGESGTYGSIRVNGRNAYAHRVSYEIAFGAIPAGMVIDHICHTRKCVRPAHLQAVSQKQNSENLTGARPSSKTGIRGVSWSKRAKKWVAFVRHNRKNNYAGLYESLEEAEVAVIAKRNELFSNNLADRAA